MNYANPLSNYAREPMLMFTAASTCLISIATRKFHFPVTQFAVLFLYTASVIKTSMDSYCPILTFFSLSLPSLPFSLLQTMTVADFGTTLAHLVRVCWSAAAVDLHLASIGDSSTSTPPLSSGSSRQGSSSPSQIGKGVGKEVQLQAGICEKQADGSVSSKVNYS